ncbi:uncharacterized protein LOC127150728 [Cucumis melo]|uniref:Uncharacterized protein LOC127150728 n=1 Tax=Cucumis melo TaxID=3656 RepID=A0ABM3L592_CUCME|nr:uncharacterized protein LOC127150728 [Cucumis melo]
MIEVYIFLSHFKFYPCGTKVNSFAIWAKPNKSFPIPNIFKLSNTCKSAKVEWDTLEVAFEGTSKVKISRLQILTSRFEALQMTEEETIVEFNVRVLDIANELDALGEKMSNSKLVWKLLRSLPSKFNMKVTMIEEANDLSKMKLDELFGSLRTFELHLGNSASRRKPCLALTSVKEESKKEYRIAKLKSQLHKHIGSQRNSHEASSTTQPRTSSSFLSGLYRRKDHERNDKDIGSSKIEKSGKGIRCHECEGFGHIQSECATYLKHKKKSLVATLSDEEDYSESDDEEVGMALISITTMNEEEATQVTSQASDQQKSMVDDCLNDSMVQGKWKEDQAIIIQQQERIQCLMEENQSFLSSIVTLKAELNKVKNQFEELTKFVKMLTNWSKKLDDLIGQGKRCNDKRGVGFTGRKSRGNRNTVFVRECDTQNSQTENARGEYTVDAALLFDNGYSRHMIGNVIFFSELSECNAGSVVFGDGGKGRIIGKGTINHPSSPYLLDVCLVHGLSANLISISQLCDQGYQDSEVNLCNLSKAEEASLWHKRLGHISGTSIAKVAKVDVIIGFPTLTFNPQDCCSDCPTGKQVKSSHKPSLQNLTRTVMESINVIIDNHEKVSNGSVDEEDGDIWAPYS